MLKEKSIFDYLEITNLKNLKADINTLHPFGYNEGERGATAFLNLEEPLQYLALIELKPGVPRGNHKHSERIEILYIISGKVKGKYWCPGTLLEDAYEVIHEPGTFIRINPGLFHELSAVDQTWVLECSPIFFNIKDIDYFSTQ